MNDCLEIDFRIQLFSLYIKNKMTKQLLAVCINHSVRIKKLKEKLGKKLFN